MNCTVLYSSLIGSQTYVDRGFDVNVKWDIPLLEGYQYKVLSAYFSGNIRNFLSCTSPQVVTELRQLFSDGVALLPG